MSLTRATAIVLREYGGPEVLRAEPIEVPEPGPDEALIRQTAIGINFHDVYVRSGLYRTLALPGTPGIEAAGVVEALGANVKGLTLGDRVAYVDSRYGSYADRRTIAADRLVRLPASVDDRTGAAAMVKGLTAWMLLARVHPVRAGDSILVHAAAGGVGRVLCQWASHLGATVIGTVGSEEKAGIARRDGCRHTIVYTRENVVERVREITNGRGVDVVYDAVGRDTFAGSLESLAIRGHLVNYGQASGPIEPFAVSSLGAKSNTLSRPIIFHYLAQRDELEAMTAALFDALERRIITIEIGQDFPLGDAAGAHRALEARATTGSTILVP